MPKRKTRGKRLGGPFFSVIIPTRNRPESLVRCLEGFARLDYPDGLWEIIVVNDGGDRSFASLGPEWTDRLPLRLETRDHAGPAAARNAGAKAARGTHLAFTDDDCRPDPGWLTALADRFSGDEACLVGGRTVNALPFNLFSAASQALVDYLYAHYNPTSDRACFLTSNNLAVPANLFDRVGGFDCRFVRAAAEDREFCDRCLHQGFAVRYAAGARVHHAHALNLTSFLRQHLGYGQGAYLFHRIRAERTGHPLRVEPLPFYLNLMAYPFLNYGMLESVPLFILLLLSQAANTWGFFLAKRTNRQNGPDA